MHRSKLTLTFFFAGAHLLLHTCNNKIKNTTETTLLGGTWKIQLKQQIDWALTCMLRTQGAQPWVQPSKQSIMQYWMALV
jgi:hypothetical protein